METYRHYVRLDADNVVTRAFSDAFEQPQGGDVCVTPDGTSDRHCRIEYGNALRAHPNKWNPTKGLVEARTENDLLTFLLTRAKKALDRALILTLAKTDRLVIQYRDEIDAHVPTTLTEAEYASTLDARSALRDKAVTLEVSMDAARTAAELAAVPIRM